jgi:aminopeptidase N
LIASKTLSIGADTYPRQPGVDALHYVFRLTLGDDSDEIAGEATVRVRLLSDGVDGLALDLTSVVEGKGMTVSAVSSDGRQVPFTHRADRLELSLPSPSEAGQEVSFTIAYHGVPADGLRMIANAHGERTIFSENWPNRARQWLPTIDHPSDKATGELIVVAPERYQVVANGLLIEEIDLGDGLRQTHWRQSVPIASWLYAIGVARFAVHHAGLVKSVPLQSWAFPQDRDPVYGVFEEASRRAMELFSERVGPYAFEKLANVQAAGIRGGTEHATAIFYGESDIVAYGPPLVVHEVAHQWFGNAVTVRDWDDIWLSEGFATYFALLYVEHFEGRDAFVEALESSRQAIVGLGNFTTESVYGFPPNEKIEDTPVVHRNLSDMSRVLNGLVYQKGAWTLHMLRDVVGTETFWRGIREYYHRYRNGNASTDELRRVMEEVSGRELDWFFHQWLHREGVPRLEGTWRYDRKRHLVEVALTQAQTEDVFRLPIDIGVVVPSESQSVGQRGEVRSERVDLEGRQATFSFPADAKPLGVVLDPGTWLLTDVRSFAEAP